MAGVLLGLALGSMPVQAQITADPSSFDVELVPGDEVERTVTITNTGSEAVSFCLSFDRPLQREGAAMRLGDSAVGEACGPLGEILLEIDQVGLPGCCSDPYGLTMMPEGRLFVAERDSPGAKTIELTPDLGVVRSFEHPVVGEFEPFPSTEGVTYNADTGTLWWLNIEEQGGDFRRALLLEGTLDGEATGRRVELPPLTGTNGDELRPSRLSYDPAEGRYYLTGYSLNDGTSIWAVDSLGEIVNGYPIRQTAYPDAIVTGPDAHGGASGEAEAVRLELTAAPQGSSQTDRLIVVDIGGSDLGTETPLPNLGGASGGSITGEPLRSRLYPNGVLYFPFTRFFETKGIVGIRPHPLPPSWLSVSQWDGSLGPGESAEVVLTFSSGTRTIGNTYTAALQVFEADTGNATEAPLSFEVVPKTDAEDEVTSSGVPTLSVFPNPTTRRSVVRVRLPERSDLRLKVFDVLGRQVAVLHLGPLAAGQHSFSLDGYGLPSGIYLVRAETGAGSLTQRVAITR